MSEPKIKYSTIRSMKLNHLPNDAMLLLQRQTEGVIPTNATQFGLPWSFINSTNSQRVTMNGPSIQVQQIPELIKILQYAYEKYSGKDTHEISAKTNTFADLLEK